MKRKVVKTILDTETITILRGELVIKDRRVKTLEEQLKAVDEAVFGVIQSSRIASLGKVTDAVMRRMESYSGLIAEREVVRLTTIAAKRKRKSR
jgi:hypothetical protein